MRLRFRGVATSVALSFFALALTLMIAPHLLLGAWGLEVTLTVGVICRRAAALLVGIAVMLFLARNAEPSLARSALVKGSVVACLMLAALGAWELAVGHVTAGILMAISVEVALALALRHAGREQSDALDLRRRA